MLATEIFFKFCQDKNESGAKTMDVTSKKMEQEL